VGATNDADVVKHMAELQAAEADNGTVDEDGEDVLPAGGKTAEASDSKADDDGKGGLLPAVSVNVSRKGTEIRLQNLRLGDGAATLVATRLSLIIACGRCSSRDQLDLVPGQLYTVTCSRCHSAQLLQLNTDIAHSMSSVIGFINLDACQPVDLVLTTSQFLVGCIACSNDATIDVSIYLVSATITTTATTTTTTTTTTITTLDYVPFVVECIACSNDAIIDVSI